MRRSFILLLSCVFVSALSQAQLSWSKHSYPVVNFRGVQADFTGDGYPDLLLYDSNNISILPNMGNGLFDSSRAFVSNQKANDVALLDFNRDGQVDVAACDGTNLVILKGNGDGTLTVLRNVPVACASVVAADFNHDGNPDIAVNVPDFSNSGHNQVIVYLGDGTGGIFETIINDGVTFSSSDGNPCVLNGISAASDFTGDKVPDIAITADCPNDTFSAAALIVGAGDGTGHFSFHRDVEFNFDAGMRRHLTDVNGDGKQDIIALAQSSAPHGLSSSAIIAFHSNGNGTFALQTITQTSIDGGIGSVIDAFAFADFDSDGTKDIVLEMGTVDLNSPQPSFAFQFLKGQPGGTYKLVQTSPLASQVLDMVWDDFDKDGRADVALLRQRSTDVWLNQTSSAPICSAFGDLRTVNLCTYGSPTGVFHFIETPLDNHQINALQVYVDGTLKFQTLDDLLNTKFQLHGGWNRVTAKGWDDLGPFSTTINLLACINDFDRTVKICSPTNGSSWPNGVHIVASAATSHPFSQLQVYVDGVMQFRTSAKYVDIFPILSLGLTPGSHRITVKGWDSIGAFSSTVNVMVTK